MIFKLKRSYISYILIVLVLLIDSLFLTFIKTDIYFFSLYLFFNLFVLFLVCIKNNSKFNLQLSILMMLFIGFFIEFYIHYLKIKVFLCFEYIYLIPLLFAYIKRDSSDKDSFRFLFIMYCLFNLLVLFIYRNVTFFQYVRFMAVILTFYFYYQNILCLKDIRWLKDMYIFIFYISVFLTFTQSFMGFNQDTRNGIFSVFGWSVNTLFIMIYPIYSYYKFLIKKSNIVHLILSILLSCVIFIITESKATIVFLFINLIFITVVYKKIPIKKIVLVSLLIYLIPVSFNLMIQYSPKFSKMNNLDSIIKYYTGNNNRRDFRYGRYTALGNVFNDQNSNIKIFGRGFGASTPFYRVFYSELGRNPRYPFYISLYGYNYGFHLTSLSTVLLDGGIVLLLLIIIFILKKVINSINSIRLFPSSYVGYVQLGFLIYFIYLFAYSHVFTDYRNLALVGLLLGLNPIDRSNLDVNVKHERNGCNDIE